MTLRQLLEQLGPWAVQEDYLRGLTTLAERAVELGAGDGPQSPQAARLVEGTRMLAGETLGAAVEPVVISGTAILSLHGLLIPGAVPWWFSGATSTEQIAMQFLSARDNADVERIAIRCCSAGGSAFGAGELSDLIFQSRGVKPIIGWGVNGPVSSAAYVILSACDEIRLTTSSMAGSIGVIATLVDVSAADKEFGIKYHLLRYPANKALGHPHEPLTPETREKLMTSIVMPVYRDMVSRVGRNRGVSAEVVEREYGGGLEFIGQAAVTAGLADRIDDWNLFVKQISGRDSRGTVYQVSSVSTRVKTMNWTPRMKAMLFAAGLLDAGDADDAVCQTALRAWCAARGVESPSDEAGVLAMFRPAAPPVAQPITPAAAAAQNSGPVPAPPGTPNTATSPEALATAVQQALTAERTRQTEIREAATLLGLEANDALVTAALDNPATSPQAFSHQVVGHLRGQNRPVGRVEGGTAALDRFTAAAVDALLMRAGPEMRAVAEGQGVQDAPDPAARAAQNQTVRECAGLTFYQLAEEAVRLSGARPRDRSPEEVARTFLSMSGEESQRFALGNPRIDGGVMAADPIHGAGDYPNLIAGLANRVVAWAANMAPVTYAEWGYRFDDLPDFNARQILQMSGIQEFDERPDGREVVQTRFQESRAWIQRGTYAQGLMLTPRMVVGGLLSEFIRGLMMLQIGHERTLNRLCIDLLQANPTLAIDGVALFNGAHNNQILGGAGGGPSVAQANIMRRMIAQQPGIGDTLEAGLQWAYALHGSNWINEAEIYFDPRWRNVDVIATGVAEADVNIHAGRVKPLYDPMLGQQTQWYGIANKMQMLGMVYAFGTGYGPGGQRTTYYKPETKAQHYDFEGSFGAAIVNWQPFLSNAGA